MSQGGIKHDDGKAPLALIPPVALRETAAAFAYGAKKYGQWNFMRGMAATRLASAAMRHIEEYLDRHNRDPESSAHVLGHAMASLAMLMAVEEAGVLDDDRKPALQADGGPHQAQQSQPFKLRVGGKYRSRNGKEVHQIVLSDAGYMWKGEVYNFRSDQSQFFRSDGRFDLETPASGYDLVEEVFE